MGSVAVRIEQLSKRYRIGAPRERYKSLRENMMTAARGLLRARHSTAENDARSLWALSNVCAEVQHGEVLGIVGPNGAGKSTLLKILSRITEPTAGYAQVHGRVGSLLEVGTGFHPELTGRENIFLNGAVLGMSRNEIRQRFDEIVAFADLERFLETPVKHYSIGMYMRLAFSIAAHLQPEILVIDEVLAVGDIGFQKKCLGRMEEISKSGRTVLFVSHNLGAISSLCSRCILLHQGVVKRAGTTAEVLQSFRDLMLANSRSAVVLERKWDKGAQITRVWLEESDGTEVAEVELGQDVWLCLEYVISEPVSQLGVGFVLYRDEIPLLFSHDSDSDPSLIGRREAGTYVCRAKLPTSVLKEAQYSVDAVIGLSTENWSDPNARVVFRITNTTRDLTHHSLRADRQGLLFLPVEWERATLLEPSAANV